MLTTDQLRELVDDWYETVPENLRDKVVASSFSIKPITLTPTEIRDKVRRAASKAKTREEFARLVGVCGEFMEALERLHERRAQRAKKAREKS